MALLIFVWDDASTMGVVSFIAGVEWIFDGLVTNFATAVEWNFESFGLDVNVVNVAEKSKNFDVLEGISVGFTSTVSAFSEKWWICVVSAIGPFSVGRDREYVGDTAEVEWNFEGFLDAVNLVTSVEVREKFKNLDVVQIIQQ